MTEEQKTWSGVVYGDGVIPGRQVEVEKVGKTELLPDPVCRDELNTTHILETLVARGADLDMIQKFMDLRDRDDAKIAKQGFDKAMAGFHTETIVILKDRENTQYRSRYSSKGNIISVVAPLLGKWGLSHRFVPNQSEKMIEISCILTHALGHSESATMHAPPDTSGQKNPIQQIKSTKTYLEIATFEAVTGIASTDATLDDDGNAASGVVLITEQQKKAVEAKAVAVGADMKRFLAVLKLDQVEDMPAAGYKKAMAMLEEKRRKMPPKVAPQAPAPKGGTDGPPGS